MAITTYNFASGAIVHYNSYYLHRLSFHDNDYYWAAQREKIIELVLCICPTPNSNYCIILNRIVVAVSTHSAKELAYNQGTIPSLREM